jgi:tetratricopeptide (TPR) repeat protein
MDLAAQTWQQVLLTDPNNPDALGGLARAAKLDGNAGLANTYLERLKAVRPNDPTIAKVQAMGSQQSQAEQLQQAGKLAGAGQYAAAMAIYKQVFGESPPAGDWSLAYYETEAATEDGRPHAVAGLRALAEKNPEDPRYQIALGRILTYSPQTRAEGRRYLARYPKDAKATEALRQSLLWDSANPAMAGEIRAYLATHPDAQLEQALKNQASAGAGAAGANAASAAAPAGQGEAGAGGAGTAARPSAAVMAARARSAEETAAYAALNAKHVEDAETRFQAILEKDPDNPRALAGMGYVRMQQANFAGAISFLEHAKIDNSGDKGLEAALDTARFWFLMGEGLTAFNGSDLTNAERQYRAALLLRPDSPEALEGLGGTLLKARQPSAAIPLFARAVEAKPGDVDGWRGLVTAQYEAGNAAQALAADQKVPAAVHSQLMGDPLYLRMLALANSAAGRDADALRMLQGALGLAFPADATGVKAQTQIEYAGILFAQNKVEQAAAQYRQVLAGDHGNTAAWQGLVRAEHTLGHDADAMQTVEAMPPANYAATMKDAGFETTVASVYEANRKLDVAQDLMEKALAQEASTGQKAPLAMQMQLAGIYSERGKPQLAYPIYQRVLTSDPANADAWAGLLAALHVTGHDKDAIAQLQLIPAAVRSQLETSVGYLQTMAAVYGATGQSREATLYLDRAKQHYAAEHSLPPAEVEIQNAWLLFNGVDDAGLYRQLMELGDRPDLTAEQRRTLQTIWTNWAVRRANQAAAVGNTRRALAILNAAADSFPGNPLVTRALANGYAQAGEPQRAVEIYKAQGLGAESADDYQVAVGAALAVGDSKDADIWLRRALAAYPADAQVLILAAKFEQSRGDTTKAITYYRASLNAMPAETQGSVLAGQLGMPAPTAPGSLPSAGQARDLSILLAPGMSDEAPSERGPSGPVGPSKPGQPYLPGYGGPAVVPPYMSNPAPPDSKLKESLPQSRVERRAMNLPSQAEVELTVRRAIAEALGPEPENAAGSGVEVALEAAGVRAEAESAAREANEAVRSAVVPVAVVAPDASGVKEAREETAESPAVEPVGLSVRMGTSVPAVAPPMPAPSMLVVHDTDAGGWMPKAEVVPVQLGDATPHPAPPPAEVTDVLPTAHYAPNPRVSESAISSHPDIAAAEAEEIRRHQSDVERTGQSHPSEEPITVSTEDAVFTPEPQPEPQELAENQGGPQVTRPATPPAGAGAGVSSGSTQQYQQPSSPPGAGTQSGAAAGAVRRRAPVRRARVAAPAAVAAPAPAAAAVVGLTPAIPEATPPAPVAPSNAAVNNAGAVGGVQANVALGPPIPLTAAPSDAELMAMNMMPMRGYYAAQAPLPGTARQQVKDELAALEGSYSGWLGGTGIGRYRSGTAGIDRLYDLEVPAEASTTLGHAVRLTAIARLVFLNSGVLNTGAFAGQSSPPFLGTLPGSALTPPAQQFSKGLAGELQLTTKNLGLAAGTTPYDFLVRNYTGRLRFRPLGGPVTIFADRDSVRDTQLSYAGLRDPGTIRPTYAGTIWGGVVATTAGVRLDLGRGGSGIYLSGDGGVLKGDHVQTNQKVEGAAGAYFHVKTWPQSGTLSIGASAFGMHYEYNELGMTYGQGGYFSPRYYILASVPVTFSGYYRANFHYLVSGGLGVQTFQQDWAFYYPLDPQLQNSFVPVTGVACTGAQIAAHTCGATPQSGTTGFNYTLNSEVSYRAGEHWYVGGFVSASNTNNYNTVSGGFFLRLTLSRQHSSEGYPTGLFPVEGFRPLQIP